MSAKLRKSVTLIELLIAISLLAVMILGINSIDVFSRFHFFSTDRRAKLQNDVSYCLEHMTKYFFYAIGNESLPGMANSVVFISPNSSNTSILSVFVDANGSGVKDAGDTWSGYLFNSNAHKLTYYAQCADSACSIAAGSPLVLSSKITAFSAVKDFTKGPYVNVSLTACWDPTQTTATCGTSDNPSVTMATSLALPSVSNN